MPPPHASRGRSRTRRVSTTSASRAARRCCGSGDSRMSDADRLETVLATVPDPADRAWLRRVLEGLAAQCAASDTTASRFPFVLQLAGLTLHGLVATEGDGELQEQLGGLDVPRSTEPIDGAQRGPGRPSYAALLTEAVAALGRRLDRRGSLAEQARQVLKHIAGTGIEASAVPSLRTAETFLSSRRNSREKLHGNSRRGKRQARRKRCSTK